MGAWADLGPELRGEAPVSWFALSRKEEYEASSDIVGS